MLRISFFRLLAALLWSGFLFGLGAPRAQAVTLEWVRQLGTSEAEDGNGVSADGLGNVYISGLTSGSLGGPNAGLKDAFVAKYDAAGNLLWMKQLGTSVNDRSLGVSADGLGNVYVGGNTGGSLGGPNAGMGDAFVAKYSDRVPEPSTLALCMLALAPLYWQFSRRRNRTPWKSRA